MPNNYKQASKKAQHEAKVSQLDNLGNNMDEFIQAEGMTVLEKAAGDFIERVHKNINNERDMITSGKISNLTIESKNGLVNIMGSAHLIYQDRGVNGAKVKRYDTPHSYTDKMPPVDVFKDWIKNKQIFLTAKNDNHRKYDDRLTDSEKSKDRPFKELTEEQLINQAAWGMATKVYQEGFKPRNLYSKEIPKLVEDVQRELADFAVQQIVQVFDVKDSAKRIIIGK